MPNRWWVIHDGNLRQALEDVAAGSPVEATYVELLATCEKQTIAADNEDDQVDD